MEACEAALPSRVRGRRKWDLSPLPPLTLDGSDAARTAVSALSPHRGGERVKYGRLCVVVIIPQPSGWGVRLVRRQRWGRPWRGCP